MNTLPKTISLSIMPFLQTLPLIMIMIMNKKKGLPLQLSVMAKGDPLLLLAGLLGSLLSPLKPSLAGYLAQLTLFTNWTRYFISHIIPFSYSTLLIHAN